MVVLVAGYYKIASVICLLVNWQGQSGEEE